jgi:hypothetical protein
MVAQSEGVGDRQLINPPITDFWNSGRALCQTFDRRQRRLKSLSHECYQSLLIKGFGKKWEVSPAYAIPCQILVDIAGHEDHPQVFSYTERAEGQLVAMYVRELIGARGQLKARRGKNEVCEQQIDGPFVLCADFEGL